jgi:hypothetical protein
VISSDIRATVAARTFSGEKALPLSELLQSPDEVQYRRLAIKVHPAKAVVQRLQNRSQTLPLVAVLNEVCHNSDSFLEAAM